MTGISLRGATLLRSKTPVFEDLSFTAPKGAITAILGESGAGKTSLLAAIAGLLKLDRGAILSDGVDITRLAAKRRGIAFLAPGTALPPGGPLVRALRRQAGRGRAPRAAHIIGDLALDHLSAREPGSLSHAEALLALTAARLLPEGRALLLDEAASGLDEPSTSRLYRSLRVTASAGQPVLLATRAPAVALLADHLVLLSRGRVIQAGRPASLYAEPHDAACALLTGPANILTGQIRELRPGGFVWSSGGRFVHESETGAARPKLGAAVSFCLRPERIALLAQDERADNTLDAVILDVRAAGALLHLALQAGDLTLSAAIPSWGGGTYPACGQQVRVGWAASAAQVLAV